MIVEFIIPTYNRIDLLKCMVASLVAQTDSNWTANVVIDDSQNDPMVEMLQDFEDDRITHTFTGCRYNDFGHSPREIGKQLSRAAYIVMTGDDNYYTPNFVQELKKASVSKPGVIYWDMVHSHYGYAYFKCAPGNHQIDMGAFATRRDIAQSITLGHEFAADGYFIENIKARYPREQMIKIEKILFVHN